LGKAPARGEGSHPVVAWLGASPLEADELLIAKPAVAASSRSPFEVKMVEEWLNEKLAAGPKLAKEIDEQAALDAVPPVLLRRARISLGVIPSGRNGSTLWKLPEFPSPLAGEGLGVRGANRSGELGVTSGESDQTTPAAPPPSSSPTPPSAQSADDGVEQATQTKIVMPSPPPAADEPFDAGDFCTALLAGELNGNVGSDPFFRT
jgi:hypothetical protein